MDSSPVGGEFLEGKKKHLERSLDQVSGTELMRK